MGKRPKKKIVLVLVEGQSDINALSYAIPQLYDEIDEEYEVFFPVLHDERQTGGDITSKYGVRPENIERLISKLFIDDFLKDYGLYPKDITEIIQIIDIDGVYIDDDCVLESKGGYNGKSTYYAADKIETADVASIVERNKRKRENLDHLSSLDRIKVGSKTIDYYAYYFSCNMDHMLHGDANIESFNKCRKADEFTDICIADDTFFSNFFCMDNGSATGMTYEESWQFIKESNHSLERHSNLNLLIERLKEE